jgi:hypothetical protein
MGICLSRKKDIDVFSAVYGVMDKRPLTIFGFEVNVEAVGKLVILLMI